MANEALKPNMALAAEEKGGFVAIFAECYSCASLSEERGMVAGRWMLGVAAAALMAGQAKADLVISNKATANVNCTGGECTATAPNAVLNAGDLANLLAAADAKVATGGGALNILVRAPLSWTSTSRLTLDANQSVEIGKPVSVTGSGAVTIATNDGGSGGDLMFDGKGAVTFWDTASSLVIDGNSYTLVKDIATLASDIAANPSGFYALANDYDASKDGTYSSAPIPGTFAGTFDGLGHIVISLKIVSSDFAVGFFGAANGAAIRDLRLKISISGTSPIVGGLLGESDRTAITGCSVAGSISLDKGSVVVGGLVGGTNSTFPNGTVVRSGANVDITAPGAVNAGGLVGASGFKISQSYATGEVNAGKGASVGALVGITSGDISESFATGAVTAGDGANVGGYVGLGSGQVNNSYASGAVEAGGKAIIGGFAGEIGGMSIASSYSTGHVKGKSAGGFLGNGDRKSLSADYWDTDTTGKGRRHGCGASRCGRGAKGLTTQEFQSGLPAGFSPTIWGEKQTLNGGLPYLLANPPK